MASVGFERLSRREMEVLALVSAGLTNKEIAQSLVPPLSANTVKGYVRDVLSGSCPSWRIQSLIKLCAPTIGGTAACARASLGFKSNA